MGTAKKQTEKRIQEGRGQGTGKDYKAWLKRQDIQGSKGISTRDKGLTTDRKQDFLSRTETKAYSILDLCECVVDIQEQYPLLPLAATMHIAKQLQVRHPTIPGTKDEVELTTDLVVTVKNLDGSEQIYAFACKEPQDLASIRVLEKLEIERRYWQCRGAVWGIITKRDIPEIIVENVGWLRNYSDISDRVSFSQEEIRKIATILTEEVERYAPSLRTATEKCDERLFLKTGDSLVIAYHLIVTRQWRIDWNTRLKSGEIQLLSVNLADQTIQINGDENATG